MKWANVKIPTTSSPFAVCLLYCLLDFTETDSSVDWLVKKGLEGRKDVEIPDDIVKDTRQRYLKAYTSLTGKEWRPPQESDALSMQGDMFDPTLI